MKTISLRTLVRTPLKVKRMTRAGKSVRVTDNGDPLWVIQPAVPPVNDAFRRDEMENELAEIASAPKSKVALSTLILNSRR